MAFAILIQDIGLAIRNLRRNARRSIVAIFTVACGVIAFLLASGFIAWIFEQMREGTIHSQLGHVQIVRPGYFKKGIADPYAFLLPEQPPISRSIENIEGFQSIAPRLAFNGLISRGDITVPFVGEGVDPVLEKPISTRIQIIGGQNLVTTEERKVLLGEGLAKSLGASPGDTVVLLATTVSGGASALELTVAGIFSTYSKEYDDNALRLPILSARKLMRVAGATSWVVLLDRTEQTSQFIQTARKTLSTNEFEVIPWNALADFYNKTEALFSKQVYVMKVIIGLIIILTITNTLTMSVLERTTEIGTSLAVGLRGTGVMRLFVIEGVLIGVVGGVVGVALGYLLAMVISMIGIPMPPPPGMAHGYIGQIVVTPELALDAIVLALVTTLLASAFPAWKAGRMNIVDALRYSQ